ncbi:mandelate racemase [Ramlibacter sp. AW1]|uniref:Mandelate racemase n=1 Tax=Ramlibacter aurantiacus TaxID=2801330 RepID=A0A937D515_9BURK|nr:enolase C-terminal domain-like protein [Ramlibacter aurantiacus]MBL0420877.1 mandelate racemase [Ramlibacter aurantiacus]
MKITDISLTLFHFEGLPPTAYAAHLANTSGRSELGLVRIATDDGLEGHSFLGSAMRPAGLEAKALVEGLKPLLMGQDPLDRERLHQLMARWSRTFNLKPLGAMDVALWDLAGKAAGLPIHRLLGSYRHAIPVYASSQKLASPQAYAEQALEFKAQGYQAYKIHPVGDAAADVAICERVREAVGDAYPLMLDASFAYRFDEAVRVGRAIERMGFRWYEDPLTENDIYNCAKLRQKLDVPLMATELPSGGLDTYPIWITERATDYLRGDVPMKGGITTMVKTAHLAEAFNLQYEVHHGGNSMNNLAGLHVAMAIRNCEFFEMILPMASHRYALLNDPVVDAQGFMHAPTAPGLGAEIDFDLIRRNTITELR